MNQLLQHPVLSALLLLVAGILVLLAGGIIYLLVERSNTIAALTPTPTTPVQFATPTPPPAITVTLSPTPGSAPLLALLPVQGEAGVLLTITGKNWAPGDSLLVRIDDPTAAQGLQPLFANTTVATNGTFITSFLLPANTGWSNLNTVQVTVESPATGARTAAEFSIVDPNQQPTPPPPNPQPADTPTPPLPLPTELRPDDDDDDEDFPPPPPPPPGNWRGEYFNNPNLVGPPVVVQNQGSIIDFNWGFGSPAPLLSFDGFSARWLLIQNFDVALYRFYIMADDGVRLWINDALVVDEWYSSSRRTISVEYTIPYRGLNDIRLEYADFSAEAGIRFWWEKVYDIPPPDTGIPYYEWRGSYWANINLFGEPVFVRGDPSINFDWGGGSPTPGLPTDNFSIRWERIVDFEPTTYRFYLTVNDGARVWLDGYLFIDEWRDGDTREITRDFTMRGGPHEIRVEYYERSGNALVGLRWDKGAVATSTPSPTPTLPPDSDASVSVAAAKFDLFRRTGAPVGQISVISITPVEWRDSNLGCPDVGRGAEVITPGYLIILEANSRQYEYHTDEGVYALLCGGGSLPTNTPIPTATPTPTASQTVPINPATSTPTAQATDSNSSGSSLPVEIPSR